MSAVSIHQKSWVAPPVPQRADVWAGDQLGRAGADRFPTGAPSLDAQLPDAGWPLDGMVEILQEQPGRHVWQLLSPGLAQALEEGPGPVVLVGTPHEPFGPGLAARGLPAERLLCIRAGKAAARLWATEQALRCADVVAVLSWIPQARNPELRRLHMAAQQHQKLFFAFRGMNVRNDSSPARLRLVLGGLDEMHVQVIKRRGPPMVAPIVLAARGARLAALLQARSKRGQVFVPSSPTPETPHALDRTSAAA